VPKLFLPLAVIAAVYAGPAAAATRTAGLQDDFFVKGKLTINKGDTIHWTWSTDDEHTVTDLKGRFGSKQTDRGSFRHKFKKRGKFTVYCLVHPTVMRQKITVK
jgi:plastocyanin